jgi:hypothetical protein
MSLTDDRTELGRSSAAGGGVIGGGEVSGR